MLGSGDGNIHPPLVLHKPDASMCVIPHAIENYDGNVIFIPGNHDWYSEGIQGLNRQRDYLKEKFHDKLKWAPDTGSGFESIEISDNIQLVIIDSQWYLEDWDRHPLIWKLIILIA